MTTNITTIQSFYNVVMRVYKRLEKAQEEVICLSPALLQHTSKQSSNVLSLFTTSLRENLCHYSRPALP